MGNRPVLLSHLQGLIIFLVFTMKPSTAHKLRQRFGPSRKKAPAHHRASSSVCHGGHGALSSSSSYSASTATNTEPTCSAPTSLLLRDHEDRESVVQVVNGDPSGFRVRYPSLPQEDY